MTAYNAKHPYEPDWQIPRGVGAKASKGGEGVLESGDLNLI